MKKPSKVTRELTLSKYNWGLHHFNPNEQGTPSFYESLSPLSDMIETLYSSGVPLGSKIEVTMKVKSKRTK